MDLTRVSNYIRATSREDLVHLNESTAALGGGTWLFSEEQNSTAGLVDLTTMGWPAFTVHQDELEIAATCTLAELHDSTFDEPWPATRLFRQGPEALLASFKVWNVATVGGNICLCFPAGAVLSVMAGLDAELLIWRSDGSDMRVSIIDFVVGPARSILEPGDIVRSVHVPRTSLESQVAFRKVALRPQGRSGNVVVGRREPDGSCVVSITASTTKPVPLRFASVPDEAALTDALDELDPELWHFDAHGSPQWREHMAGVLSREVAEELRKVGRA